MSQAENWRAVPGYEGAYEVSDQGRVRSLDRMSADRNGRQVYYKGRLLRPGPHASGHLSVVLGRNQTRQVHALVLLAFEGVCPPGQEVLHDNHRPADNRRGNLRYGTRRENLLADYEAGTRRRALQVIVTTPNKREKLFKTLTAAAAFMCVTQPAASRLVKTGGTSRYSKMKVRIA